MNISVDPSGALFDGGPIPLTNNSALVLLAVLRMSGARAGVLSLQIGANAISHFKLTFCPMVGGHDKGLQTAWRLDGELNTPDVEIVSATNNLYQSAGLAIASMHFDKLEGKQEVGIWGQASSSNTTVRPFGSFVK